MPRKMSADQIVNDGWMFPFNEGDKTMPNESIQLAAILGIARALSRLVDATHLLRNAQVETLRHLKAEARAAERRRKSRKKP
jgi:hypothetical protein